MFVKQSIQQCNNNPSTKYRKLSRRTGDQARINKLTVKDEVIGVKVLIKCVELVGRLDKDTVDLVDAHDLRDV